MSWNAKTLHVSPTGRALPTGKTYRMAGSRVKYARGNRPLPQALQCHPQPLTPTPLNPQCVTRSAQYNVAAWGMNDWAAFMRGAGLWIRSEPGDWKVVEPITGEILGYALCSDALAYRNAAALRGATLEVYDV